MLELTLLVKDKITALVRAGKLTWKQFENGDLEKILYTLTEKDAMSVVRTWEIHGRKVAFEVSKETPCHVDCSCVAYSLQIAECCSKTFETLHYRLCH